MKRPPRPGRTGLAVALVAALVAGGAWWTTHQTPLTPPSGPLQEYGAEALRALDSGYRAHGAEWEVERDRLVQALARAEDESALHEAISAATDVAGGRHSQFYTPDELEDLEQRSEDSFTTPTVVTRDRITTVRVPAVGVVPPERQREYAEAAADGIDAAAPHTCGWIVDLRGNSGGNMYPMISGLVTLLPDGPALSFVDRHGEDAAVTVADDGVGIDGVEVPVGHRAKAASAPIAVLQDRRTASSGEAVATAFRGLPQVESFGSGTAGLTSANEPTFLPDGAILNMTTSVFRDRRGVILAEEPIAPDHPMAPVKAEESAVRWIRESGCPSR